MWLTTLRSHCGPARCSSAHRFIKTLHWHWWWIPNGVRASWPGQKHKGPSTYLVFKEAQASQFFFQDTPAWRLGKQSAGHACAPERRPPQQHKTWWAAGGRTIFHCWAILMVEKKVANQSRIEDSSLRIFLINRKSILLTTSPTAHGFSSFLFIEALAWHGLRCQKGSASCKQ